MTGESTPEQNYPGATPIEIDEQISKAAIEQPMIFALVDYPDLTDPTRKIIHWENAPPGIDSIVEVIEE